MRTLLFVAADDVARREKAWDSGADAVILDLEDAVAPDRKAAAREGLGRAVAARSSSGPALVVRVNAPDTDDGLADLEAIAELDVDHVLVPKASAETASTAAVYCPSVIALVETARGVLSAEWIAATPGVSRLMLGPVDLAAQLRTEGDEALLHVRSRLVLASAAAGIDGPIDGPHMEFSDLEALRTQAATARRLGFTAKACIHPAQLAIVAAAFAPTEAEIDWARRVLAAHADGLLHGRGVVALDGEVVDAPVAKRAEAILEAAR